jgi:hypothetical protein
MNEPRPLVELEELHFTIPVTVISDEKGVGTWTFSLGGE